MFELPSLPQEMGDIIIQGLRLGRLAFRRLFTLTSILAFMGLIPTVVQVWGKGDDVSFAMPATIQDLERQFDGLYCLSFAIVITLGLFPQAMVFRRIMLLVRGQAEPAEMELRQALRLWPSMLMALVIFALALALGFALLFVPCLILWVSLMFSQYAVVLDGQKPFAALNFSHQLVWGNWWRTFGFALLIGIPPIMVAGLLSSMLGLGSDVAQALHGRDVFKEAVVDMVVLAFIAPFFYSIQYLYYHDLKLRKQVH